VRDSLWTPLSQPAFRAIWIASVVSNVGTWMQNVGVAWLMTELTPSPVLVALIQTATSLPVFLVGLPAGALADVLDRRRMLLVAQTWMLLAAAILGGLTLADRTTPMALLLLTFALGLGGALNSPAWQAIVPELVPRRQLASAVALNGAGHRRAVRLAAQRGDGQ
jgi:MFS family permease